MEANTRKKEIKHLVYFLIIIWILNIAVWVFSLYSGLIQVKNILGFIIYLLPLILIPFVIVGLWKFKKWGLILGYILSIIVLITNLVSFNIIGIIIWGIVLYYLIKSRRLFK